MHDLPSPLLVREVSRRYGNSIPAEVLAEPELLNMLLPALRADLTMSETYVYTREAPLDCPVSVYGGTLDTELTEHGLNSWKYETTSWFHRTVFPGGHFFLQTQRACLLEALSMELGRICHSRPAKA